MGCRNINAYPVKSESCGDGCMMVCGYVSPGIIALMIAALAVANDVYFILLIVHNSHTWWRVFLSVVFMLIPTALAVLVLWSFKEVIFTSPGYVPSHPWEHSPRYGGASPHLQSQLSAPPHSVSMDLPPGQYPGHNTAANPFPVRPLALNESQHTVNVRIGARATAERGDEITAVIMEEPNPRASERSRHREEVHHRHRGGSGGHNSFDPRGVDGPGAPVSPTLTRASSVPRSGASAGVQSRGEGSEDDCAGGRNPYYVHDLDHYGMPRFCQQCRQFKPDKAHHCRICGRCVYSFDHHCPFINNCVGRNNYKLFLVFLLYGAVGCLLAAAVMLIGIFAVDLDEITSKVYWVVVPGFEAVLSASLFCFYFQHLCLVASGQSTLDSMISDQDKCSWPVRCQRDPEEQRATPQDREAARVEKRRLERERAAKHKATLLGDERPWWRGYLPYPVRTDDTADETAKYS